ncbi:SpoIIE family protein phosphatase [Streptodolium elevatio]
MTGIAPEPGAVHRRAHGPQPPAHPAHGPPAPGPGGHDTLTDALDEALSTGLAQAVQATGAYGGVAYLRSPDRRALVLAKVAGLSVSLVDPWGRIPVHGAMPAAEAFRTGRIVFLADAGETVRRFPQLALGMPYAFASATAAVRCGDEACGAIVLLWPATPGQGLTGARRRRLRAACVRLGNVLAEIAGRGEPVEYDGPPTAAPLWTPVLSPIRVGLFDWNTETGAFAADDVLCELFGVPPADFDGRATTLADRVVSGGGREFREAARRAVDTGRVLAWRLQVEGEGGVRRLLELWGRVPDDSGPHLVGAVLDLGFGAAAAEAVERLRDGVFSLDPDGRITYANRNLQGMLGIRLEDVIGRTPWEAFPWLADPSYEDRYRAAMLSQQPGAFLARTPHDRWLAFSLYPDPYGVTGKVVPVGPPPGAPGGRGTEHDDRPAPPPTLPATPARLGAIYHVLQMAGALTEAVSVDEVCEVVADQILPAFGGQELAVYIVRDGRFHLVRQTGYPEGFLDPFEGVTTDAGLPGVDVLTHGVPIFFESVSDLTGAYPGIPVDEMSSWAFLPLIASDRPVGSCILGFGRRHVFSPEERSVLTALSGLIAQALERARLFDAESALARGLQHALLPHRLPDLPHLEVAARYLPGTQGMEIGGDWYDVIDTGNAVALVIGDVEGHSVAAAGIMGQLRSAVRAFSTGGKEPGQVVACTNRLLADLDPGLFASCCYIELDTRTGVCRIVRAGHPPPIVCGPDADAHVLDVAGGTLLGVDRSSDYPVTRVVLRPGSLLALYTDGLVEDAGDDIGNGIERLRASVARGHPPGGSRATVAVADLADRLVREAGRVTDRADDVALLLTRWTGQGERGGETRVDTGTATGTDDTGTDTETNAGADGEHRRPNEVENHGHAERPA